MFERFTERARQVVVLAQDESRTLKHNFIGTEHILLGLLREEEGLAARVLDSLDITVEEVRARVAGIVIQGDEITTGQIPFTPRAKKALELALREEEGLAARVLDSLDITVEEVRAQVARIVGQGDEVTTGQIPFTPRAKKVLELALREALLFGHNYIGTEHLLLAVLDDEEGSGGGALTGLGISRERARGWLVAEIERIIQAKRQGG